MFESKWEGLERGAKEEMRGLIESLKSLPHIIQNEMNT